MSLTLWLPLFDVLVDGLDAAECGGDILDAQRRPDGQGCGDQEVRGDLPLVVGGKLEGGVREMDSAANRQEVHCGGHELPEKGETEAHRR